MKNILFKVIILGMLYAPTFGQTHPDSLQHKVKTLFNDQQYIEENTKSVWWDMGIYEQFDITVPLTSENFDGTPAYSWYTTIMDFKIGKSSKFYFYSQLRFGTSFFGDTYTIIGDTTGFTFGGLIGMGGKIAELYAVGIGDRPRIIRHYLNGGIMVETPRYSYATSPLYGYEVNHQTVIDYNTGISVVVGTSMGLSLHHLSYTYTDNWGTEWSFDDYALSLNVGIQLGFMF